MKKKVHFIKCLPEYFQAQLDGIKNFEIRKNDRDYQVGDKIMLLEYNAKTKEFTLRRIVLEVTYITDYMQKPNYVVLGTQFMEVRND